MHPHKREAEAIDLIDYMDILQIRKVIDADNHAAIQLIIDGYLSEKDHEGGTVSEVAEPENGENGEEYDEEAAKKEGEGVHDEEESEATE